MKTIEFEGQTRLLHPPDEMNDCSILPVADVQYGGLKTMHSFWMPSALERQMLLQGACVRLVVVGEVHPPVAVDAMFCVSLP